jgi:fatty-acyl-CoA synthase
MTDVAAPAAPVDRGIGDGDRLPLTLGSFVTSVVHSYRERDALAFGDGTMSYASMGEGIRRFSRALLACGFGKGDKVAVLIANRPEFVIAAFGAVSAGCVIVPLSTLGTTSDHAYVLRHSDAAALITQVSSGPHAYLAGLSARYPALRNGSGSERILEPELPFLRKVVLLGPGLQGHDGWDEFLARGEAVPVGLLDQAQSEVFPSDDAIIVYTSGTTARPKAVLHSHRSATAAIWRWGAHLGLAAGDRLWSTFPFFWTAGFSMTLGGPLASGACVVMQEGSDPDASLELIRRHGVTVVHNFDHTDAKLAQRVTAGQAGLESIRLLRRGSPLRRVLAHEPEVWEIGVAYGTTETFTLATGLPRAAAAGAPAGSNGPVVPGIEMKIVEPETGETVATDSIGEVVVRGPGLMRGYYKRDATDFLDGDGWFHTGDTGFMDRLGHLHWTGRRTNLIKSGGANVSPIEVEKAVARLELLDTFAVVGVPHPTLGEAVVLCATVPKGGEVAWRDLCQLLEPDLASYKRPRAMAWLDEADFGFTDTDKIRSEALRAAASAQLSRAGTDPGWADFLAGVAAKSTSLYPGSDQVGEL